MSKENKFNKILSKSECTEIICKACNDDNINLVDYHILQAGNDIIGYLGEYFKLHIKYIQKNVTKTKTFFIKSLPLENEGQKATIDNLGFMRKEKILYTTLFEDMKKFESRKWHADLFLTRDDILVFDDLQQLGYVHYDSNFDLPPNHIKAVLECLAAMHGNSIAYEISAGINVGEKYQNCLFEISLTRKNTWIAAGINSIIKLASIHPNFQTSSYQNFIKNDIRAKLDRIFDQKGSSKRFQNSLCHRDLWAKNLLYKHDDDDQVNCLLVDFQINSYKPPAADVLFFLYLNVNNKHRKENLKNYLDFYYNCLTKFVAEKDLELEDFLSRDDFDESCNEYQLLTLVLCGIYAPIVFLPDGYFQIIQREDPDRYNQLMQADRSDLMAECIEKYEIFGSRMMDIVAELVDFIYKS